jgi:voltage-gated potassium channel Kch
MPRATLRQRLHYAFDNQMARGPVALIGWLAVLSAAVILAVSLVVWAAGLAPAEGEERPGLGALAWMALMRTLDAGTMGGDQGSWPFLFAMLAVTFGGIFVISTLIGLLTSGIEAKLEELRKGRSRVLESGHTVILGWSPRVFTVLAELAEANANQRRHCVVVLADRDKVEMEDEIRARVPDPRTTRIVCRSGDPADLTDLERANVADSRAVVILPPPGPDADSMTIKVLLAITNHPQRRSAPYHLVAEIQDPGKLEAARIAGRGEAELVLVSELLARVTVQTCRQSGLSIVFQELLDFGGDEIYFQDEPRLIGRSFGDALLAYPTSTVIGLADAAGRVRLNPPMATPLAAGDRILAISADDDTVRLGESGAAVDEAAIREAVADEPRPERTLVLGWSSRLPLVLRELAHYVTAGSTATVVVDPQAAARARELSLPTFARLAVRIAEGDITDRRTLVALDVASYDHVILLSDLELPEQQADARTLLTLLHLRDLREREGTAVSLVSEMRDVRNCELAAVTRADDFIVGDRLVSLLLTQIAENPLLHPVFDDLFDPEGSEIYLKPAAAYVEPGRPVTFATVVAAARRRGEVAIGYRRRGAEVGGGLAQGVRVNPPKDEVVTFAASDSVIVLAES